MGPKPINGVLKRILTGLTIVLTEPIEPSPIIQSSRPNTELDNLFADRLNHHLCVICSPPVPQAANPFTHYIRHPRLSLSPIGHETLEFPPEAIHSEIHTISSGTRHRLLLHEIAPKLGE